MIEATVADIHAALINEHVTIREVVKQYLERIDAYNEELNAILTVNPNALDRADELDAKLAAGEFVGPLHGIPTILKDNQNTADMPTTGGAVTLEDSMAPDDAFVVEQMRTVGAIIIAKANLHELAGGGTTVSSLGGQTRNPYALDRTPGGSSGGTGAALATNMAPIGFGTDTVNSIRSPASACNLVGLRPSMGLVSREGTIPVALTQDMVGPITQSVADAARILDVIAGYDPEDPSTAQGAEYIPESYTDYLNPDGLKDTRIGVLRSVFASGPESEPVVEVAEEAVVDLETLGATTIEIDAEVDVDALIDSFHVGSYEQQAQFNDYLDSLGDGAPIETLEAFVEAGEYDPSLESGLEAALEIESPTDEPEYFERLYRRNRFIEELYDSMAAGAVDALFFPHQKQLVAEIGDDQLGRNGFLSSGTGFSSITVPGGFSKEGVPVGVEFLCRPFDEPTLFEVAYAYEQGTRHRCPPEGFGPVE
ncbi:amidase [Halalkalicoccus jeotgali B3]|uniref:Amidase n=1 Tax=Halalkalicoccus jeotgali (strain DSM 18796 / CECT 7217 / JCM 14584 / KCTC 4019 / B3) TaxID=795797 RepID=D8J799_HALJB|nr:amidase [Halalkalicoccus jeotgali B3]ELY33961.1 amidase [Halalkalicoccus jeotgali B3]